MQKDKDPFAKRIRRRLTSRSHTFLAVSQAALQALCRAELEENGFPVSAMSEAGPEFSGALKEGWRANLVLRIPSRVYCRVARFRAGAREELFRRTAAFPWELWLAPGTEIRPEAHVRASRLKHEGAAAEAFAEGMRRHYEALGLFPGAAAPARDPQRILVRLVSNICEISLDMSGPPLYERGYRQDGGEAPLRESLAAALLRELGWRGEGVLADAMTGSGTLAIEAALVAAALPPGLNRGFQFQAWPSFSAAPWEYLRKKAAAGSGGKNCRLLASDISAPALGRAQTNAAAAGIGGNILWENRDFFDWTGAQIKTRCGAEDGAPAYLVLNPPYGRRLEGGGAPFYHRLGLHVRKAFQGWNVLVLFSGGAELKAFGLRPARLLRPRHGGLSVHAGFFEP
jgi:23S rRNA G2445 N2-methylase RlmL